MYAHFAFSTMPYRISCLPDSIICHILSFLPTKQVVATSVLSKRWKLLWRSVPSLDFDHEDRTYFGDDQDGCSDFLLSVYSLLLWRDMDKPLHRLRFRCCSIYSHYSIETWIKAAVRTCSSLEHLDLDLYKGIAVPSVVFSCKTLVVLKLANLVLRDVSFVDFPLLKILHLNSICFSGCQDLLQQFLSGSPNLEDLEAKTLDVNHAEKFNRLSKLVRANIDAHLVPLENVKNVQILVTDGIHLRDLVFDFLNLVKLELTSLQSSKQCLQVLEVLKHCPKLQTLFITIFQEKILVAEGDEETLLSCRDPVPTGILLHLKTCCLKNYRGSVFEFQFAEYILLNANYLRTMKFCIHSDEYSNLLRRHDMIRDLSSCSKSSDACTLSFEKLSNVNV